MSEELSKGISRLRQDLRVKSGSVVGVAIRFLREEQELFEQREVTAMITGEAQQKDGDIMYTEAESDQALVAFRDQSRVTRAWRVSLLLAAHDFQQAVEENDSHYRINEEAYQDLAVEMATAAGKAPQGWA